jgi:serine/threonine-protein kinase
MNRCPPPDDLRRLLADELSGPEAEAVETHLEECAGCQQALEQLTAAAGAASQGAEGQGEGDSQFLRRLQEQPPTGARPAPDQKTAAEGGHGPATPTRPTVLRDGRRDAGGVAEPITLAVAPHPGSRQTSDLPTLLRKRLRFLSVLGWIVVAVAACWVYVVMDTVTLLGYAFMLVLMGGLAGLLWSRRALSLRHLRWVELILFASMALLLTQLQWLFYSWEWLAKIANDDWLALVTIAGGTSVRWVLLTSAYGLLIPNTWRRCAAVVGVMALWPVLFNAVLGLQDRPFETRLCFGADIGLNMAIAASLAIYGSHRIEVLRRQALEARKLGPYQLKRRLGAGGMGEVYLAEHVLLRRPCAIKLIRPEHASDPQSLRRFEREVRATATLSHPNTVEVFDYGHADDGTFYYAMEYLPGLSLKELVERHGPLPPERAVHLLRQVCGALHEAHGIGLVHRDVKPGNVLVCERGGEPDVAKLLDFGLVRAPGPDQGGQTLTGEGMIAGTPAYMSPEQTAGRTDLDARSDIYSLGAVAYFLLTGRPPFVRATAMQTLAAHLTETVTAPDRHRPDVPADLQAAVLRCLEKDPTRRWPDVDALEQALVRCDCAGRWTREQAAYWWRQYAEDAPHAWAGGNDQRV